MFVILYYDVNKKLCPKIHKICKKYLQWVQNSVFEGEISEGNLAELTYLIEDKIKKYKNVSIIVYKFRSMNYIKREVIGIDKKDDIDFI
ncbi:MAG: CRISPR-associated endonuclease Cas2 [Candidatus Cloacimonadota bacterium]|nr:MAG: CRISPR-associated endonuclease Cas2 [Candidatus Cloacimonadota bacterium]PIE78346.1 MAG: CRISPR-associated endonuclease Cas2 [Candidatus Delongbacteria bacterium]